jgi:hypothetical protein
MYFGGRLWLYSQDEEQVCRLLSEPFPEVNSREVPSEPF